MSRPQRNPGYSPLEWYDTQHDDLNDPIVLAMPPLRELVYRRMRDLANRSEDGKTINASDIDFLAMLLRCLPEELSAEIPHALAHCVRFKLMTKEEGEVYRFISQRGQRAEQQENQEVSPEVLARRRAKANRRQHLFRNGPLKQAIRERDQDTCRYCGQKVTWGEGTNRLDGGTFDHLDPDGDNTMDNLVVACRLCNSAKGGRAATGWRAPRTS